MLVHNWAGLSLTNETLQHEWCDFRLVYCERVVPFGSSKPVPAEMAWLYYLKISLER